MSDLTIEEKIEVMKQGPWETRIRGRGPDWYYNELPNWNWDACTYRRARSGWAPSDRFPRPPTLAAFLRWAEGKKVRGPDWDKGEWLADLRPVDDVYVAGISQSGLPCQAAWYDEWEEYTEKEWDGNGLPPSREAFLKWAEGKMIRWPGYSHRARLSDQQSGSSDQVDLVLCPPSGATVSAAWKSRWEEVPPESDPYQLVLELESASVALYHGRQTGSKEAVRAAVKRRDAAREALVDYVNTRKRV